MKENSRIILNTAAAYLQSVITLGLTLFSIRWVLLALGQTDYGLWGLIGSTVLLVTMLSNGLSVGVTRFFAFSIGSGKNKSDDEADEDLARWFNTALSIHLILPVVLVLAVTPLAEFAVRNWLTIPVERIESSILVLRISIVAALFTVMAVPFVSMFTAYQRIYIISISAISRSVFAFGIGWFLLHFEGDRLVAYALWMASAGVFIQLLLIIAAVLIFKGCRIRLEYMFDWQRTKKLFSYVGWKMFGLGCVVLRMQGTPVVLNLYHGPVLNSAYAIANSVSMQASALSSALTRALQPAVVSAEGSGDRQKMISLSLSACKFGALLVMAFAIPAIVEMHNVLKLWLVEPPQYAGEICQWLLAMLVIDRVTGGHMLAVNAYGKIRAYELVQGTILFSATPITAILFYFGVTPSAVGVSMFATSLVYCSLRVVFAKKLINFPIMPWFREVLIPITFVLSVTSVLAIVASSSFEASFVRILITTSVSLSVLLVFSLRLVLNGAERDYIFSRLSCVRSQMWLLIFKRSTER